ncbi:MAG: hypothetical protein GJ676_02415 [Rhodobacteraceae bacterium]|nr:hypothetical protein [Paracoccaceae bacterium]
MNAPIDTAHPLRKVPRKRKPPPIERRFARWLASEFVIPAGQNAGQPFELHLFQLEFLREYLADDHDGPRWRTNIFSTPRKLGKSTFLGAIMLGHLCPDSPIHIPHFTGAIAAPTEKHCGYIAKAMKALMDGAGREEEYRNKANPRPGIIELGKGTVMLNTGTNISGHGADLDVAMIDETGLMPGHKDELVQGFYDALATKNGRLILTGTRGDSDEYNDMIERPDPRTHVCLYGASKDDDPHDPETWEKANPDQGLIKPRRFLKDAHDKAEASGSMAAFQNWQLNVPVSATRELLIDYDTLKKAYRDQPEPIPGEPCHVGLDLGGAASMTAAVVAYESGVIKVLGAFPGGAMDLLKRGKRDHVDDFYVRCAARGELLETSGNVTDVTEFLPEVVKLIGPHPVRSLSCDRYRAEEMQTAMAKARLDWPVIYRGTGPKDGDKDIRATRKLFLAGAITLERSLLLEGGLAEADVKVASTGACQIAKANTLTSRIDVAQALCLACSALLRAREEVAPEYVVEVL